MAKYRVWYGDDPTYKNVSSLAEAIKFIKKKPDFDESNSGLEELVDNDYWDEWLDEDDQNVHEHLYMYGGKSKYLRVVEEDDDEDLDDEDLDDDEDIDEEEEDLDDDEVEEAVDNGDEDLDERLMDVIGGGRTVGGDSEESFDDDDEEDLDDDDEDDEDLDDDDDLDDEDLDDDEKDY